MKSLTGGNPKPVANTVTTDEKVQVKVTVGPDTVYSEKQSKDATKITVPVEGIGNVEIKVYIDDVLKGRTTMDFNTSNPTYTFE